MKIKTPQELKEQMISEVLDRYKHHIEETQRRVLSFIASANDSEQYKRMAEDARFTFVVDTEEHAQIVSTALRDAGWGSVYLLEYQTYCVRISHRLPQPRPEVGSREWQEEQATSEDHAITLRFETKEQRGAFINWFIAKGGSNNMLLFAANHNKRCPNNTDWNPIKGVMSFSRVDE